jgi:hypothetical protein
VLDAGDAEDLALPVERAYDRAALEQYLAAVEAEASRLEQRLEAAKARRVEAEEAMSAGHSTGLASALHLALVELHDDEQELAGIVGDLRASSAAEARRILKEVEHEVLVLRAALEVALREVDGAGEPPAPALMLVPDSADSHLDAADVSSRRASALAHPAGRVVTSRSAFRSVASGPSLAG